MPQIHMKWRMADCSSDKAIVGGRNKYFCSIAKWTYTQLHVRFKIIHLVFLDCHLKFYCFYGYWRGHCIEVVSGPVDIIDSSVGQSNLSVSMIPTLLSIIHNITWEKRGMKWSFVMDNYDWQFCTVRKSSSVKRTVERWQVVPIDHRGNPDRELFPCRCLSLFLDVLWQWYEMKAVVTVRPTAGEND